MQMQQSMQVKNQHIKWANKHEKSPVPKAWIIEDENILRR